MAIGKIKKLVHLSLQSHLPNARLVPDHNDKGYGIIQSEDRQEVYFPHDAVEGRRGFDDLCKGQTVEFTLDGGQYLRARWVQPVLEATASLRPAA